MKNNITACGKDTDELECGSAAQTINYEFVIMFE